MSFDIKTLDLKKMRVKQKGAMMPDWTATTAWEVEAERRREVLDADLGWRDGEPTRGAATHPITTTTRRVARSVPARLFGAWRTSTGPSVRSAR